MRDKPTTPERDLPPPCLNCRSLHKQYGSSLCEKRRTSFFHLERLRALPLLLSLIHISEPTRQYS